MISLGSVVRFVFISFFPPSLLAFTHSINHPRVPLECQVLCWAFWRRQKDEGTSYCYREVHRLRERCFHSCTIVADTVHIEEGTFLNQSLLHLKRRSPKLGTPVLPSKGVNYSVSLRERINI